MKGKTWAQAAAYNVNRAIHVFVSRMHNDEEREQKWNLCSTALCIYYGKGTAYNMPRDQVGGTVHASSGQKNSAGELRKTL